MEYDVRERSGTKHLKVAVHPDGRVVVSKPPRMSMTAVERWLAGRAIWIEEARERFARHEAKSARLYGAPILLPKLRRGTKAYKEAVERARKLVTERVRHFAREGGFTYTSVSIRNQKTRWGSCSARGGLSFNYRLVYLRSELLDYLVVHELSHTKHHNHSPAFWKNVEKHIPEYTKLRREMYRYRF